MTNYDRQLDELPTIKNVRRNRATEKMIAAHMIYVRHKLKEAIHKEHGKVAEKVLYWIGREDALKALKGELYEW